MAKSEHLTRREFLKFASINLLGLACPKIGLDELSVTSWPSLRMDQIPEEIQAILQRVPQTVVGSDGYLQIHEPKGRFIARAPQAVTEWNRENSTSADRLLSNASWGIVLHWYGDKENFDRSIKGYIRGFDSLREVDGELLRTSAHFLVGDAVPFAEYFSSGNRIGILQTQAPAQDGTPFVGSHLRPINYKAHHERKQYFVRALYQLEYDDLSPHTLLQDMYDGPRIDPNQRTIAIEIAGYNFEKVDHYPSKQKIANVLSLVWALMKRYQIPASCLLGHHEIQLSKADPGKKFMALIRYLIAVKALVEPDNQMKRLVFGKFLDFSKNYQLAVQKYLEHVRSYLVLVSTPRTVYEWEVESKYWFTHELIATSKEFLNTTKAFHPPLIGEISAQRYLFLLPENHEGVDLCHQVINKGCAKTQSPDVYMIADGKCIFSGKSDHCCSGQSAIFRHRQQDGAEILSVYTHLKNTINIHLGMKYPTGYVVGQLGQQGNHEENFLHFSLAYGASWDIGLKHGPEIPLNAGTNWISNRYIEPLAYLADRYQRFPENITPIDSKI